MVDSFILETSQSQHITDAIRDLVPFVQFTLREKCPNTEFFLIGIFLYSDQKKLRIWTLFTQC